MNTHFDHRQETVSNFENHFYYSKEGKLKLIQETYENGYMVNKYADIKLNYNKLKIRLYETLKENIEMFFDKHISENIETMALRLWIDDLNPMLDINFRVSGDKEFSVAEWSYSSVADINIADVPLDSTQQDKIVQVVYAVLIELIDNNVIHKDIKLKVLYHDEIEIGLEKKSIKKIIKGRENYF